MLYFIGLPPSYNYILGQIKQLLFYNFYILNDSLFRGAKLESYWQFYDIFGGN